MRGPEESHHDRVMPAGRHSSRVSILSITKQTILMPIFPCDEDCVDRPMMGPPSVSALHKENRCVR